MGEGKENGSERENNIIFLRRENDDEFPSEPNSAPHRIPLLGYNIHFFADDDSPQRDILDGEFLLRMVPMTAACCRMPSEDEGDSPAKCRERRRRRIEMRRLATTSSANPSPSTSHHRKENNQTEKKRVRKTDGSATPEISSSSSSGEDVKTAVASPSVPQPVFGMMSVSGRSREMEDAVSASTCLLGPENCRRRPVHFFAVYDGHGGPHVKP